MKTFELLKKLFNDPLVRFYAYTKLGLTNHISDEKYLKKKFKLTFGYELNLDNPQTFNEKLQWLKLYDRKPEYTMMVDKYLVRKYIADKIGEQYLIPLLGVWDDPDDIDFNQLPNQFVIKCNHNSGEGMCICKDKSKLDIVKVKAKLRKSLKRNYYFGGREWPYKDVPRKIIAEKYMGGNLDDYKLLCFNGKPQIVEIHKNRFTDNYTQTFYNIEWKQTDITQGKSFEGTISQPETFDLMVEFSSLLSKNIYHLRVDWYEIDHKLYFGELTFYDGSGFLPFDEFQYDLKLGQMLELPQNHIY